MLKLYYNYIYIIILYIFYINVCPRELLLETFKDLVLVSYFLTPLGFESCLHCLLLIMQLIFLSFHKNLNWLYCKLL